MEKIKKIITSPILILVLISGAFFAGRFTSPAKIKTVEIEKRVEIHHESLTIEKKLDIQELKTMIAEFSTQRRSDLRKVTVTNTKPTGETTTTETLVDRVATDTVSKTDSTTKTSTSVDELVKLWKESVKTEEKIKIVEKDSSSEWGLGIQAGLNLRSPLGDTNNVIPGVPEQIVLGAFVERRLFLNIYTGVWLNSRLDGGLQVRMGF